MTSRFRFTPWLFLAPALLLIAVFVLYPIVSVVYYSFTDFSISTPPEWIGLANYQKLVGDPTFWLAFTHSIVYLIVTPILIVLSIGLAIIVNRHLRGIHIFRALYYVPAVAGTIAIAVYEWIGVEVLKRAWINLDVIWVLALLGAGAWLLLLP